MIVDFALRPSIAVIDYGMGNLHSAVKGLEKAGAAAYVAKAPSDAEDADGLVLPGVGNFGRCMENLRSTSFDGLVLDWIGDKKPFLGICLGLQLLYASSEEADTEGLGLIDSAVVRLPSNVRVPHMGWNTVEARRSSTARTGDSEATAALASAVEDGAYFYFVHSYAALEAPQDADVILTTHYGVDFIAGFQKGSLWATQFHPEKSGASGIGLLESFVRFCMPSGRVSEES